MLKIRELVFDTEKMNICYPVFGKTPAEVLTAATCDDAAKSHMLEWRADDLAHVQDEEILTSTLAQLRERAGERPLLFTLRTASQGGKFLAEANSKEIFLKGNCAEDKGTGLETAPKAVNTEHERICIEAIRSGYIDMIDVEYAGNNTYTSILEEARKNRIAIIASLHKREKAALRAEEIIARIDELHEFGGDIAKLAFLPENEGSTEAAVVAGRELASRAEAKPFVIIAMGEAGTDTRRRDSGIGSCITFAKGRNGESIGQLTVEELLNMGATNDSIIKVENLTFEYTQTMMDPTGKGQEVNTVLRAVDNINLEVARGSFTAIIGQNGSGKSTLAKNFNGLLLPSGGAVYVNGYDTTDEEAVWIIRQTAGMVFQNPDNQLVSSIVEDDVAFGPENIGLEPKLIRERVDEALQSVGMTDYSQKAPHQLSGGQKQRIAIAGVIAMKPECIIFDEPTAMLDPHGRDEVMAIIERLNAEGITIVLITHFMEEAAKADRIVIMEEGKIVMDGTPKEVFARIEEIHRLRLDVPLVANLADRLRNRGIEVPEHIVLTEDFVKWILS